MSVTHTPGAQGHQDALTSSIKSGFCGSIGNTPLIELESLSKLTGCRILGKAEFLNPGGSVKDRAALGIIQDAESKGLIQPGGTVVEGTAGNTGIGLTLVAQSRGYRSIIVVPETQSSEKLDFLRAIGADLRTVPAAPYSDPNNFNHAARRIAQATPGAFWANQFDNDANAAAHYRTTGPEIFEQTQGQVDGFICSVGTGGTLSGVSRYLKARRDNVTIGCVDPGGAAMYSWFANGNLEDVIGNSITEGIGQNRVTANVASAKVDCAFRVLDESVIAMTHYLLHHEGLFLGSTSGINVCGALRLAARLGPGHTIVTILCDSASRYLSRIFNNSWLEQRGLLDAAGRGSRSADWIHTEITKA
jgi:cysteine synthase A